MSKQSLSTFIANNSLPARVKVVEGIYTTTWEFSNGDVLDLHKLFCPSVQLQFVHPDSGEAKTISASTQSPCLFKIMPYIPDQAISITRAMVIHGTVELIRIWPSVVCIRSAYINPSSGIIICKGEKLRLKRLLEKDGQFLLECSRQNAQLVLLPLTCDLEYLLVEDTTAYTLAEIADMQGRVERRLRLSEDSVNKSQVLPGMPKDFIGDVIMAPAKRCVEIHPADSPGEKIVVPIDIDITISDRDDDYIGPGFKWYPLQQFVEVNSSQLPMMVAIADWDEEPVSVQAIRASISDRIVLFKREEVLKVACQVSDSYFVIPLTYDASFEVKFRMFSNIEDVCESNIKKVRVLRDGISRLPGLSGVREGEVLEVMSAHKKAKEVESVYVQKEGCVGISQLPLNLRGEYQEVLDIPDGNKLTLQEINPSVLPLTVTFRDPSASIPSRMDRLPRDEDILILFMFSDNCVRTSKNMEGSFSSFIPTRASISVRYISQHMQTHAPEMSALASCPEQITEERLEILRSGIIYENVDHDKEETRPPPLKPRKESTTGTNRVTRINNPLEASAHQACSRPRPDHRAPSPVLVKRSISAPSPPLPPRPGQTRGHDSRAPSPVSVKRSISAPSPPLPPRPGQTRGHGTTSGRPKPKPKPPHGSSRKTCDAIEESTLYQEVADPLPIEYTDTLAAIFDKKEPPSITIPADANISSFKWTEMVIFLQLMGQPKYSLKLFARDKVTGADFATLTNSQLQSYGVNNSMIQHYKSKSKKTSPLVHYL